MAELPLQIMHWCQIEIGRLLIVICPSLLRHTFQHTILLHTIACGTNSFRMPHGWTCDVMKTLESNLQQETAPALQSPVRTNTCKECHVRWQEWIVTYVSVHCVLLLNPDRLRLKPSKRLDSSACTSMQPLTINVQLKIF